MDGTGWQVESYNGPIEVFFLADAAPAVLVPTYLYT